jgi:SNF2 family DNA or RNA helicase
VTYQPRHPDYNHQTVGKAKARGKAAFAYFMEQGTGKTKVAIDEMGELAAAKEIDLGLVIAPNGVHRNWHGEVGVHMSEAVPAEVMVYRSGNPDKAIKQVRELLSKKGVLPIVSMNVEAMSTESGFTFARRLLASRQRACVVVDECQKISNPTAGRTKHVVELSKRSAIRRVLTGTMWHEGLERIYAPFRFLDKRILGHNSYSSFRAEYCIMGGFENRSIVDYRNMEGLRALIDPSSFEVLKKECLDLPDVMDIEQEVELSPEQARTYRKLKEELIIELESGGLVDATIVASRLLRLQQILSGFLRADDGSVLVMPCPRAEHCAELVEEARGKVIVFCRFQYDVELLMETLGKRKIGAVPYYGPISEEERARNLARFRSDPACRAIVMTESTGGTGLTLNEASTTIFYSHGWSFESREQAKARNHRIGQSDKVTHFSLYAAGTLDRYILKKLMAKQSLVTDFRNLRDVRFNLKEAA